MEQIMETEVALMLKRKRRKKFWTRVVSVMMCLVVFCTTYALILPAITMETETFCGMQAHTHSDDCYSQTVLCGVHVHTDTCYIQPGDLVCTLPETEGHTHSDDCQPQTVTEYGCGQQENPGHTHSDACMPQTTKTLSCGLEEVQGHTHTEACLLQTQSVLSCGQEESTGHTHTEACTKSEKVLTCGREEVSGHTHTEQCSSRTLVCGQEESPEHTHADGCYSTQITCGQAESTGHSHSDSCYETVTTNVCGQEESAGHTHSDSCYLTTASYGCGQEESAGHTHTDACYTVTTVYGCGMEENAGHAHSEACAVTKTVYGCGQEESTGHTHGDGCYAAEEMQTCTLEADPEHTHTEQCYDKQLTCQQQEHEHSLPCYADPNADLETAANWEATLPELTGDYRTDVLAIAKSQLGYSESTKNYIVDESGDMKGYTRYGAWYGIPYGDWCAMYVSFCLDYAGVEGYPLDANCPNWIESLKAKNLYQVSGGYAPQGGDLIFFDWNDNGLSDHVGIVVEFTPADENTQATVRTIEGNTGNCVQYHTYSMDDATIMGYGELPAQLTEEEQAQVEHVIALIDAMPSADEIDAKIVEFEEAEDYEGEEAWLTEVYQQVAEAYYYYNQLTDAQKARVTNADKLLELEYIWSVTTYIDEITSDAPTAITSASTRDFIELNLYDYNSKINTNYNSNNAWPGFQWNGGAYDNGSYSRRKIDYIDFGNSMITDRDYAGSNNGKATTAWNIGNQGGNINKIVEYPSGDYANKPVGMSTGTEVLGRNLTVAGYPWVTNAGSMVDYFSNSSFSTKQNTESIDGLFQINDTTGGYFYNSRWNHAQYSNNKFTLYEDIITPNFITYPFGNFLPFNDITNSSTATQVSKITHVGGYGNVGYVQQIINDLWYDSSLRNQSTGVWYDSTADQLVAMLAKYRENLRGVTTTGGTAWTTWTAKDAIYDYIGNGPTDDTGPITDALLEKMYNIDWDVKTNFFFGMEMKMNFMQPKDGLTGKDNGNNTTGTWKVNSNGDSYLTGTPDGISDYPMHFYFTGDDDVWVYIDGVLFLDLSGIHRHVGGEIDFVNGEVHYYALEPATGDVSTTPYKTYTFAELLAAAGKSTDVLNSKGTFKDYSTHVFNFYYIERGSGSSVCRLNFNFPLLRQNSISVSKAISSDTEVQGNPDYKFQVLKADSNGNKTSELFIAAGTTYTIYDENDNVIGTGTTDANGVFSLKAGQRAEFTGIKENAGKYYVRELLEGTVLEQYGNITVSGESTTTSNNVTVGSDTFTGMDSPVKDMSDGATAFRFINDVDETKVGTLNISKKLTEYAKIREVKYYDIEVTLDGEKLPVGTAYTVGGKTKTVETAGIITIAADETATISDILAGTMFTVQETSGSAEGYTVTYNDSGGYTITVNDGVVSGVIKTSANVQLVVTNSEKGATVTIPGTKSLSKSDGSEHAYTFTLTEVTDSTGTIEKPEGISGYEATAKLTDGTENFQFTINYVQVEQTTLPATYYYRISENSVEGNLVDVGYYVAEVTVSETADGITAALTGMWKDGVKAETLTAAFVNTLTGQLKLEKIVDGGTEAQTNGSFTFTVQLDPGTSGVALKDTYPATVTQADGTVEPTTVKVENGVITVREVHHGESIVIHDLPIGTQWTVTEASADGYVVKTAVTIGDTTTDGKGTATGEYEIVPGQSTVVYTNQQLYELPETGGTGTYMYTMAGLMLMLISTAFLLYRSRKRGMEVS